LIAAISVNIAGWLKIAICQVSSNVLKTLVNVYFFNYLPQIVVLDSAGFSKGYGFIRFGDEKEQNTALASMMGVGGLGSKPIRV
jgi:hypothetical protein